MATELLAGRYRLGPKIGEGAVSVVYRAHDVTMGRDVAVKVLKAELAKDDAIRSRFVQQAQAAAQLSHPHIVEVFQVGEHAGRPYVVMEYLPEPDLKEIIVRYAPLPEDKVAQMGIDCCRALEYAHRRGIVHRDVKPQNILFGANGEAKLADFGIAASVGQPTLSDRGTVLGTAAYMSPEQIQGLPATTQSDLYSLGCVLYEAVTGRPPFQARTHEEVMRLHLQDRPPPLRSLNPAVSPSFEFIVNKAMAKDPTRRYRTAGEMLGDLQKVAAGIELGPHRHTSGHPRSSARGARACAARGASRPPRPGGSARQQPHGLHPLP
jgi:serine/threonine protein kinase